jgi:signal transduction histidine kinase/ligand-binding sensor domain-containing protein
LNRIKDDRITPITTRDGLPNDSIGLINQDRRGNLWISTLGGLARFDGKEFTAYTLKDGLPSSSVVSFHESNDGNLWFGTSSGLALFKDNSFITYTTSAGLSNNMIWSIEEDDAGNLWLGTDRGLNRFKNGQFTFYTTQDGLPDNSVLTIHKDRNAALWLVTPGGLARMKDGKLSAYTTREGLSSNVVRAIYEDREGSLWIGTEAGGLDLFKDTKFITYTARDGLPDDMVWAVCEGRDGSVWIGSQGGLSRLKDGKLATYTTSDGLPSNIVRSVCEDRQGGIWVGTPSGLAQFKDGRFVSYTIQDGLSSNAVWSIHEDRRGIIWIGTLAGLTQISGGKFRVYTTQHGLSADSVLSVQSDSQDNIWIGTRDGGLNRFSGGRFTTYSVREGLSDNSVRSIYEDKDGALWIGTRRGGLNRLKDGKLAAITTKDGLLDDCVYQVLEDTKGNLWMSSAKGIFRASRDELNDFADGRIRAVTCISYGTADGMRSRECNGGQPAGWRSRDGKLWFPTIKGVAVIDPEQIKINETPPPVVLEKVLVDNHPLDYAERAELPAGTDRLEFQYAGLSFVAPEMTRFKYRLEGYDKEWIDAGAGRAAYYTSIPPGNYTFRVMASNNDGVWNEAGVSFAFYLKPHFHQTRWFYILLAAAMGLLGWALYRLRIRQVKARFSAVLAERSRLAREIHDTLSQGFVGIGLQLNTAERMLDQSTEKAKHHLELAEGMVKHSLAEARRAVADLRSHALESGDLFKALSNIAEQLTAGTGVQAQLQVTGARRHLDAAVENHLLRIGQEAMTNAMKHAKPKKIHLELCFESNQVRLRVQDDGCGFNQENGSYSTGGHFGLVGMRERAERIKADLEVKSCPNEGTEVTVRVPLR